MTKLDKKYNKTNCFSVTYSHILFDARYLPFPSIFLTHYQPKSLIALQTEVVAVADAALAFVGAPVSSESTITIVCFNVNPRCLSLRLYQGDYQQSHVNNS